MILPPSWSRRAAMIFRPKPRTDPPVGARLLRLSLATGQISCLPQNTYDHSLPQVPLQMGLWLTCSCNAMLCAGASVPPCSPSWWGHVISRKSCAGCQGWSTTMVFGGRGKPYGFKSMCLKGVCCLTINFLLVGSPTMECINIENEQTEPWKYLDYALL